MEALLQGAVYVMHTNTNGPQIGYNVNGAKEELFKDSGEEGLKRVANGETETETETTEGTEGMEDTVVLGGSEVTVGAIRELSVKR